MGLPNFFAFLIPKRFRKKNDREFKIPKKVKRFNVDDTEIPLSTVFYGYKKTEPPAGSPRRLILAEQNLVMPSLNPESPQLPESPPVESPPVYTETLIPRFDELDRKFDEATERAITASCSGNEELKKMLAEFRELTEKRWKVEDQAVEDHVAESDETPVASNSGKKVKDQAVAMDEEPDLEYYAIKLARFQENLSYQLEQMLPSYNSHDDFMDDIFRKCCDLKQFEREKSYMEHWIHCRWEKQETLRKFKNTWEHYNKTAETVRKLLEKEK